MTDTTYQISPVELATELTVAWLSNPNTRVSAEDVPAFLQQMFATVASLTGASTSAVEAPATEHATYEPAVSVRRSLASRDHMISLIDGKPYRTLRRHLTTNGLTPEEYRARYGLKPDYPMVAPSYSETRSNLAKKIGLGRTLGRASAEAALKAAPAGKRDRAAKGVSTEG